jgi:hypothetical protein
MSVVDGKSMVLIIIIKIWILFCVPLVAYTYYVKEKERAVLLWGLWATILIILNWLCPVNVYW